MKETLRNVKFKIGHVTRKAHGWFPHLEERHRLNEIGRVHFNSLYYPSLTKTEVLI